MLFLSWDLEYTGLVTNLGPVSFVPWGDLSGELGEVKTIHNEKASTFHETLEVGVKDADSLQSCLSVEKYHCLQSHLSLEMQKFLLLSHPSLETLLVSFFLS